jgi:hypothetical protein
MCIGRAEHTHVEKDESTVSRTASDAVQLPCHFSYQSLGQGHHIRLLEVLVDGTAGQQIECVLHRCSLTENLSYTALSYVWGGSATPEQMILNGTPFPVTSSLAHALRWAKRHWQHAFPERNGAEFRLWVDAVCIDQQNLNERSHQVGLMREIYSKAELVLSSVSTATDDVIGLAIRTYNEIHRNLTNDNSKVTEQELRDRTWLKRVPSLCRRDPDVQDALQNKAWQALSSFRRLPYWNRVWILQETVLARVLVIFCGRDSLRYDDIMGVEQSLFNM